jgi:hypothetical protein
VFFACDAADDLRDVLMTLNAEQPEQQEAAQALRPDGPLEISTSSSEPPGRNRTATTSCS